MQTFFFIVAVISAITGTISLYQVSRPVRAWLLDHIIHFNGYVLPMVKYWDNRLAQCKPAIWLGEKAFIASFKFLCYACITMLFLAWHLEGSIPFTHFAVESAFFLILAQLIKTLLQHKSNKKPA